MKRPDRPSAKRRRMKDNWRRIKEEVSSPYPHSTSYLLPSTFYLLPSPFGSLHNRPGTLPQHRLADAARRVKVEHQNRNVVIHAQRKRRRVHDIEALADGIKVRQRFVFYGVGEFMRVLVVHAIHVGGLHQNL